MGLFTTPSSTCPLVSSIPVWNIGWYHTCFNAVLIRKCWNSRLSHARQNSPADHARRSEMKWSGSSWKALSSSRASVVDSEATDSTSLRCGAWGIQGPAKPLAWYYFVDSWIRRFRIIRAVRPNRFQSFPRNFLEFLKSLSLRTIWENSEIASNFHSSTCTPFTSRHNTGLKTQQQQKPRRTRDINSHIVSDIDFVVDEIGILDILVWSLDHIMMYRYSILYHFRYIREEDLAD